jgi:hypothetical protein
LGKKEKKCEERMNGQTNGQTNGVTMPLLELLIAVKNSTRLLSGTTSIQVDSLDDTLKNPGVRPPLRKEEI